MTDEDLIARLRAHAQIAHAAAPWGFAGEGEVMSISADRIEALVSENKMLRDAVYIDDLTVTMQASDRSKVMRAIGRALDFLNADMLVEAKTTLRAALKGADHE